jgi:hypothetical protein
MTVLAEVTDAEQLTFWENLGATYTILWDVDNQYTKEVYMVTTRPLFVVIDQDMTIRYRGSGASGLEAADAVAVDLLSSK